MALNLGYLRTFYIVATHQNISHAAKELNLSQPTVTRELQHLEDQLGFDLFIRHSRGVFLTHKGERLFRNTESSMSKLLKFESEVALLRGLNDGVIRINYDSYTTKAALSDYVQDFINSYPRITVESCVAKQGMVSSLLAQDVVDISFGCRRISSIVDQDPTGAVLPNYSLGELEKISLGTFDDVLLVGPPLVQLTEKLHKLDDLSDYPLIFHQAKTSGSDENEYYAHIAQPWDMRERNFYTEDIEALFQLIRHEPSIAVLSSLANRQYKKHSELTSLQISGQLPASEYFLNYSKESPPCLAASALINFLNVVFNSQG